jgi:serine protease
MMRPTFSDRPPEPLPVRDHDPPFPLDALAPHGALALSPGTALHLDNQEPVRSTAYIANRLVLTSSIDVGDAMRLIGDAAERFNYRVEIEDDEFGLRSPALTRFMNALTFRPARPEPTPPADAFQILQWARSLAREYGSEEVLIGVGLDHLLFASPGVIRRNRNRAVAALSGGATLVAEGLADGVDEAILDYGRPGSGGRQAVAWLGSSPVRRGDFTMSDRRPVVAVLDNGCGSHPWLDPVVRRDCHLDGKVIGLSDPVTDPEVSGDLLGSEVDYYEDALAGHGTFMTGLVHMFCPDADLLAIRVLNSDGIVSERDLVAALSEVFELARRHAHREPGGRPMDMVVLSMGYYHETAENAEASALAGVLRALGDLGVIVVTAAGNDATARPMYPAAFAPTAGGFVSADTVPVLCAGALNPDGGTALFSNMGPWVTSWEPGASLVSTMPVTFRSVTPLSRSRPPAMPGERRPLDPDDYRAGFAVWSGTSFAAPVLAGRLAAYLSSEAGHGAVPPLAAEGTAEPVRRAWSAVSACTQLGPP